MHPLSLLVRQFIHNTTQVKRVVIAYSGGVDSTVLLHAAADAQLDQPIVAIHVNHQLSAFAKQWQSHAEEACQRLGVPFISQTVEVDSQNGGLEQAARQARYSVFNAFLQDGDLLLTAHHQQDQAETFFLRLLRGAGVLGLAGMAPLRRHGQAWLGRPFLSLEKSELEAYAKAKKLTWVEDESNHSVQFDRNYLRLKVLPGLFKRWPSVFTQVRRSTELLAQAQGLLTLYAQEDLQLCDPQAERLGHSLLIKPCLNWPDARRNQVLRTWLSQLGYRPPPQNQWHELGLLLNAEQDRSPCLKWQDCEIRRFQQRLYCLPIGWQPSATESFIGELSSLGRVMLAQKHQLSFESSAVGLSAQKTYQIKFRQHCPDIARAHPHSRIHSQSFKKLLQEYRVEPWLRPWLPLVFSNGQLVAVGDLWIEHGHLFTGRHAMALRWQIGAE